MFVCGVAVACKRQVSVSVSNAGLGHFAFVCLWACWQRSAVDHALGAACTTGRCIVFVCACAGHAFVCWSWPQDLAVIIALSSGILLEIYS